MSATHPQQHAAGTVTDDDGSPRGLCWCGWRGDPYEAGEDGRVEAARDAARHVQDARRRR